MGTKYGYIRYSFQHQEPDIAQQEIKAMTDHWYVDIQTSNYGYRDTLLSELKKGDTVVVSSLDRLAGSYRNLVTVLERIVAAKATLTVLDQPGFALTPKTMALLTLFADVESNMINERVRYATTQGPKKTGRPPLTRDDPIVLRAKALFGKHSDAEVCAMLGIKKTSLYRYVNF